MLRAYGDGKLFGEPYGEGPPRVVWLHGWARRGQDFALAARELAQEDIASVAFDLPGFGSSPLPTVAGGARHYASLLAPILAQLSDQPLVIVGHSFGGRVAAVLGATHPELVRAVVLSGAPLVARSATRRSPWRYRIIRWLAARGVVSEARMEAARQRYGSADYRSAHGRLREILVISVNESYEHELAQLTMPIALVWGANDREVPPEVAAAAAALLRAPHSLRVLTGVGHLVPTDAPGELADAAREALA